MPLPAKFIRKNMCCKNPLLCEALWVKVFSFGGWAGTKNQKKMYVPESATEDDHFTVLEAIGWLKVMTLVPKRMKQEEGHGREMNEVDHLTASVRSFHKSPRSGQVPLRSQGHDDSMSTDFCVSILSTSNIYPASS